MDIDFESATKSRRVWLFVAIGAGLLLCICVVIIIAVVLVGSGVVLLGARDSFDTTGGGDISFGGSVTSRLDGLQEAHNWEFEGTRGQQVTIEVDGIGGSDPRARLISPRGRVVARDDDGGGGLDAKITATLPADGTYTVRIDMFTAGEYRLTLTQ